MFQKPGSKPNALHTETSVFILGALSPAVAMGVSLAAGTRILESVPRETKAP